VMNMISTGALIEIGKTYGNLMVDVQATNTKLRARASRIISQVTGVSLDAAQVALDAADGSAKVAIVMLETGRSRAECMRLLEETGGYLRRALARGAGN